MAAFLAGRLRHRVEFQVLGETQDPESGAMVPGWTEAFKAWAEIAPLSAREFIPAQAERSKVTARITVRWREGLDASMRIVHNGTIYNIEGVLTDADSGREYVTLPVSTGVREA